MQPTSLAVLRQRRVDGGGLAVPTILDSDVAPFLIRVASLVVAGFTAGFALFYWVAGPAAFVLPNLAFGALFVTIAVVSRDVRRSAYLVITASLLLLGIQLAMLGNVANGITVWFVVPNVAALLIGIPRLAALSIGMSVAEIVGVALAGAVGLLVPVATIGRDDLVMAMSFVASLLLCALFAYLMQVGRRGLVVAVEASNAELRTALATAEAANAEAAEAAAAKDRFFANVTHEIRTPLNGIAGTAELLHAADLPPAERELADALHTSTRNLVTLVNEMLSHARLRAGRVGVTVTTFEVARLADDLERLFAARARSQGLAFEVTVGPAAPAWVRADAVKIRQVATNLVANALKFTASGRIDVRLDGRAVERTGPDRDPLTHLVLTVADTGPGIEPAVIEAIFEPFVQADPSISRTHGGTGLGLAIGRSLAELLGGTLEVTSRPGAGATFTLDIPVEIVAADDVAPRPPAGIPSGAASGTEGGARRRVLVAEDNPLNRSVASRMLERLGAEVTVAIDGAEALRLAGAEPFALVLMDLQMPGKDGITAAREIRAAEAAAGRGPVRIVAMTGNALEDYGPACAAAGMDGFLTKPVELERLRELLETTGDPWSGGTDGR